MDAHISSGGIAGAVRELERQHPCADQSPNAGKTQDKMPPKAPVGATASASPGIDQPAHTK